MSKQRSGKNTSRSARGATVPMSRPASAPAANGADRATVPLRANVAAAVAPSAAQARTDEAKRADRMARQQAAREAAARQRQRTMLRNVGIGVLAVAVIVGLTAWTMINEANKPGQKVAMQASPHLAHTTDPHAAYTTDPPTSGPHVPQVPPWGYSATPLEKELQVHGLEDAGVIINFQPNLDSATLDKLKALVEAYSTQVVLAPYPNLSDPIVTTAWTRIERFKTFDEVAIRRFVDAYKGIDHHGESGS